VGLVHALPQAHLSKPGVSAGVADSARDAILLVELLHDRLLASNYRRSVLLGVVTHLVDPLVLQLEGGETEGDSAVHDVGGDIVDIFLDQSLNGLLSSGPGSEVDLRGDKPSADLEAKAIGQGVLRVAEHNFICGAVLHLCEILQCHFFHLV